MQKNNINQTLNTAIKNLDANTSSTLKPSSSIKNLKDSSVNISLER